MPVIVREFGDFALTFAWGGTDDTILGSKASYEDWGRIPSIAEAPTNIIYAGDGNDLVFAGFGNDIVLGGGGNDRIFGHGTGGPTPGADEVIAFLHDSDYLNGGAGDDYIQGGGGQDIIIGGRGNDELHGGDDDDTIFGGTGDDILQGGGGSDIMTGGAGADTFLFALAPGTPDAAFPGDPADIITDFESGTDVIDLSGYNVAAGGATIETVDTGLLVSFDFFGETFEISVLGVTALQDGDILYAA
ncbi:calcium-binding protein [Teichococcus oryzae]|uniref:Calcium-binding protein n=1 Tax=Teichococcus oryzae TaxID=1608942 RepID=A0A5B2TH87_9PROT|nr:hypothetical protein [Pseudoroseomonas oryzae]KAA2213298.1 hypothetical protein F0Q34_11810 [Pseudoroseomonas oryzae]